MPMPSPSRVDRGVISTTIKGISMSSGRGVGEHQPPTAGFGRQCRDGGQTELASCSTKWPLLTSAVVADAGRHEWETRVVTVVLRPRGGRTDPSGGRPALPAVSGCAAAVRQRPNPHRPWHRNATSSLCPRGVPAAALTARSPRSCSGPPCREGPRARYRSIGARFGPKHPTAFDLRRVSHFPDRTVGTRGTPDLKVTLTATRGGRVNLADV